MKNEIPMMNRPTSSGFPSRRPGGPLAAIERHRRLAGGLMLLCLLCWSAPLSHADTVLTNSDPAALQQALNNGGLVTFSGVSNSISLTSPLVISTRVILDGGGAITLDGGAGPMPAGGTNSAPPTNGVRIFTVNSNVQFTLVNLTLANGNGTNGGAILNKGTLVASNCTFAANNSMGWSGTNGANGADSAYGNGGNGRAGGAGGPVLGGAVCNFGSASFSRCSFLTNSAVGGNGGSGGNGGNGAISAGAGGAGGNGGGALGGAIYNAGTLTLLECTLSWNIATGGSGGVAGTNGSGTFPALQGNGGAGAPGHGAGLYNAGTVSVSACTFSDNNGTGGNSAKAGTASSGNGGPGPAGGASMGGGLCNLGSNVIVNCTFFENTVAGGNGGDGGNAQPGMIAGNGGNGGDGWGGGILSSNSMAVTNCTFSGDGAFGGVNGQAGVGDFPGNPGAPGASRGNDIARSTGAFILLNNIFDAGIGGGTFTNTRVVTNITSVITNVPTNLLVTITNTFAILGSPCAQFPQLICLTNVVQGGVTNTYVFTNAFCATLLDPSCLTNIVGTNLMVSNVPVVIQVTNVVTVTNTFHGANAYGTFALTNLGYNLSSDGTPLPDSTSRTNVDPRLGPLQDNGGPTLTMAPQPNSPAIDQGSPAFVLPTDQRGVTRPQGGRGDIGAVESEGISLTGRVTEGTNGVAGVTITVTMMSITNATTTDAAGRYAFTNLALGIYTVLPQLDGFAFTPPASTATIGAAVATNNFAATGQDYIGGRVFTGPNQTGLIGVSVSCGTQSAFTDSDGYYLLSGIGPGSRTVTATLAGYAFVPASQEVLVDSSLVADVNFEGFGLFSLSGRVLDDDSENIDAGLSNVVVTLSSTVITADGTPYTWYFTDVTANDGSYSFTNVPNVPDGNVLLTPSRAGYAFLPPSVEDTISTLDGFEFDGFRAFSISGHVTYNGADLSDAVVIATNIFGDVWTATSAVGGYTIQDIPVFNGPGLTNVLTLTVELPGYSFTPASTNVTARTDNVGNVNFTAQGALSLAGRVMWTNGVPIMTNAVPNVTLVVGSLVVTNDATGFYNLPNLAPGVYTITPAPLAGRIFSPSSVTVDLETVSLTNDFLAIPLVNISGYVTNGLGGSGSSGVTMTAGSANTTTDANGHYVMVNLPATNLVVPSLAGYAFSPASRALALETNLSRINFAAFTALSITGRVTEGTNPVANVVLALTGSAAGSATTDGSGSYSVLNLTPGNYTVTPPSAGVGFQPVSTAVALSASNATGVNFTANPTHIKITGSNAALTLTVFGLPARPYLVQTTTNLAASNVWQSLLTNTASSSGTVVTVVTNNAAFKTRFFRGVPK